MLIVALVIVVVFWVIKGLICVLSESRRAFDQANSNETSSEILEKRRLEAIKFICDDPSELVMSSEFRDEKLKEYPSLVHIEDKLFRCKCVEERYDILKSNLDVFGLFLRMESGNIRVNEPHIRHLVYQYINSIGNDDFYDAFVELLINDKYLLLSFIRECHVAESWRKECHRLYDPENYMKDFMEENNIAKRVCETNKNIVIPTDFRHRHPVSPSDPIKAYINTKKTIAENEIKLSEFAKSGTPKLKGAGFLGIIAVVITVAWPFVNYKFPETGTLFFWLTIITWFVFIFGGAFLNSGSDRAAYYQEQNSKLVTQKNNLDMLSIWAQDYERERETKIAHKKSAEDWERMVRFNERMRKIREKT